MTTTSVNSRSPELDFLAGLVRVRTQHLAKALVSFAIRQGKLDKADLMAMVSDEWTRQID